MNTPHTDQLVDRTARSLHNAKTARHVLRAVTVMLLSFAAVILIDAGYALSGPGLLLLDIVLLAVTVLVLRPLFSCLTIGKPGRRETALHLERILNLPGNPLINTLDLASQHDPHTSASLRDLAIQRGEDTARSVKDVPVVDREVTKQAVKPACAILIALLLAYALIPSAFHAVLPRLAMPFADLPPFTFVQFDVRVEPEPVYFGKPATIRAALSVPGEPGPAQVVFEDDGNRAAPIPMARAYMPDQAADDPDAAEHYVLRIERVETPRRFYITTPRGRSPWYTLVADTSPLFERALVGYEYPDYTGWPGTHSPLAASGIHALAGTEVTLQIESNVPVQAGTLRITPDGDVDTETNSTQDFELSPDPIDPHRVSVRFPLQSTGRFALSLTGADGERSVETLQGTLTAIPDRAPKIDVIQPERQTIVPEGWPVDAVFAVGDDIGLDQAVLHFGLNDTPTSPVQLGMTYTDTQHTTARSAFTFLPDKLGARAGDRLRYYAAVRDNHPGSPQTTETPIHTLHIITMEQYLELARTQYRIDDINSEFNLYLDRLGDLENRRDQLLDELAKLQNMLNTGELLTEAQQQALDALNQKLSKYAEQASALAQELEQRAGQTSLYEFEEAYKQMLRRLGDDLNAQNEQAQSLLSSLQKLQSGDSQAQRDEAGILAERFALLNEPFTSDTHEKTEVTEQNLEKMRLAEAMIMRGERIRRVAFEQDELAVLMSSLVESSDDQPARAEALARRQGVLRDELDEASKALRTAAEQASEQLPCMSGGALETVERIDALRIVSTQTAAEKAVLAGNGPLAYQAAREAADKLDSLLSDMTEGQMQASGDLDGCFRLPRQQVQTLLQQMAAGRGVPGMGVQGGSGYGLSGSMARLSMMGPSFPGQPGSDSSARSGRRSGRRGASGQNVNADDAPADPAEVIHADASSHTQAAATRFHMLPNEYREQAEAYFKRIAGEE